MKNFKAEYMSSIRSVSQSTSIDLEEINQNLPNILQRTIKLALGSTQNRLNDLRDEQDNLEHELRVKEDQLLDTEN